MRNKTQFENTFVAQTVLYPPFRGQGWVRLRSFAMATSAWLSSIREAKKTILVQDGSGSMISPT